MINIPDASAITELLLQTSLGEESEMKELLEFLLSPVRLMPWRVATVFGALLGLELVANMATPVGVATVFAAGLAGANLRIAPGIHEDGPPPAFVQGILTVFAAILLANLILLIAGAFVIAAATSAGTSSASLVREATDLPLPGMVLLGVPVGSVGAGIGAWLSHRRRDA
jgi:hypothetical protein